MLTTITYTCGHEDEIQLYGNWKARDRKQAQLEAQECPTCRAKHATERDEAQGFAAIEGSVKQIAWASDIRQAMIARVMDEMAKSAQQARQAIDSGKVTDSQAFAEMQDVMLNVRDIINGLAHETNASWYIDNQSMSVSDLADTFYSEEEEEEEKEEEEIVEDTTTADTTTDANEEQAQAIQTTTVTTEQAQALEGLMQRTYSDYQHYQATGQTDFAAQCLSKIDGIQAALDILGITHLGLEVGAQ